MWLLCTGQPSCGKTTLVKKALSRISEWQNSVVDDDAGRDRKHARNASHQKIVVSGFYTDEVLDGNGRRIGFDIVGISSEKRGILSRKSGLPSSYPKTGQYSVDVASFEDVALAELDILLSSSATSSSESDQGDTSSQIIIIDEIGRMELHSNKFQAAVEKLLQHPNILVVGAITAPIYGHRVPFCDYITNGYELKRHSMRVEVMRIKKSNRETVTSDYLGRLEDMLKELEGKGGVNKRRRMKS
jgi:nucleoside-triphosphatase